MLAQAGPRPGERRVEIGCGTGATMRALAGRIDTSGSVLAAGIPELLLARTRGRTGNLPQNSTLLADAQVQAFSPRSADLVASRFRVMFFDDPVAAFRNLGDAPRARGRIRVVCWAAADAEP